MFMAEHAAEGIDDMFILNSYRKAYPNRIGPLPIVNSHVYKEELPCNVSFLLDEFNSVFDAAAYGQVRKDISCVRLLN